MLTPEQIQDFTARRQEAAIKFNLGDVVDRHGEYMDLPTIVKVNPELALAFSECEITTNTVWSGPVRSPSGHKFKGKMHDPFKAAQSRMAAMPTGKGKAPVRTVPELVEYCRKMLEPHGYEVVLKT